MSSSVQEGRVTKNHTRRKRVRGQVQKPKIRASSSTTSQQRDQFTVDCDDEEQYHHLLPLVERTNLLDIEEFASKYIPSECLIYKGRNAASSDKSQPQYKISIYDASTIPKTDLNQCFDLIEETSSNAYRESSTGWSPTKKRKEMKLPDMKYLVVCREGSEYAEDGVVGFLSFMVTYEDGKEVIYCYEVHLASKVQGLGLGKRLMLMLLEIGRRVGMEKAMLTVFRSNGLAQGLYEALGFKTDEYSPRPRRLRNGTVKEPDYRIMSIQLDGGPYV
ncbi:GNAT family acetyltransferase Nat4 [Aspergillus sclerotioniger CBS 115572]|uniref:N-alpha-acetyltransferase 40 n=1 Tax=Aspergillus sclerotioniger CBS 115572 TaxID=1450535 RepID=A0A317X7P4_9EURO|nr:GNAT family acetyltransferase Nat4 [Aspergillus sclerotioniger CBS 115572]PWY93577.1 GNAT family acetyltransferase Nat4 [Aspergillus sclerotioniger CBS 115572]